MPGMFSRRGIVPIEAAAPPTPVAVVVFCFGAFFFAAAFFTAFFFTGFFPRSFFFVGFFFAAFFFAAFFFAFLAISQPINAVLIYTSDDCRRAMSCQADSERTAAPRTAQTTQRRAFHSANRITCASRLDAPAASPQSCNVASPLDEPDDVEEKKSRRSEQEGER